MSCFFDGIRKQLIETKNINSSMNTKEMILHLKLHNKLTTNVTWQNEKLTKFQQIENFTHVKNYDVDTYNKGYLTSSCDPFLHLLCELFKNTIVFKYCNNKIVFKHVNFTNVKIVHYEASATHFKFVRVVA